MGCTFLDILLRIGNIERRKKCLELILTPYTEIQLKIEFST
jgi:hypothetical protein